MSWMRIPYPRVQVPTKDGKVEAVRRPALQVRIRHPSRPAGAGGHMNHDDGLLDTGADRPAIPMWALRLLGIPLDEGTRRVAYSVSGPLWSYHAKVGLEINCHGRWYDICVAEVIVPDTPWSRDRNVRRPLLLGLDGFFDRVLLHLDHSRKEFWIGMPGGGRHSGAGGAAAR